jgi:uncharacterized damage-inducible protein DinB
MSISQSLLPELDHEASTTRKLLERVPADKFGWKPHEKSMAMGRLATHIAEMIGWISTTITTEKLDFAPPGGQPMVAYEPKSTADLVAYFDKNVAEAKAALPNATDQALMENWSLLSGGNVLFTMPRIACIRGMVMNHIIHHRGQLSVYLRLNNIPVPAMYGPSADENSFAAAS